CTITITQVPSTIRRVAPAAAVRAIRGSKVLKNGWGSGLPNGDLCRFGMCVYSARNSDSRSRSSMARANSAGAIEVSVILVWIPNFIALFSVARKAGFPICISGRRLDKRRADGSFNSSWEDTQNASGREQKNDAADDRHRRAARPRVV